MPDPHCIFPRLQQVPTALLVLLFSYAAVSKLADFGGFRAQLLAQPVPRPLAGTLAFLIPALELSAVLLLLSGRGRGAGLRIAFGLLLLFSGYAALAVLGFWQQVPCSCGGILGRLSWGPHLALNLFFLLVTIVCLYSHARERRSGDR